MEILGIDFGGSGIKGAPVDIQTGTLAAPRFRVPTPDPSKPDPVAEAVAEIAKNFNWNGPIGITIPAVVRKGVVYSAANIHKKWIGTDAAALITQATGCPTYAMNDADAAGLAEMKFGAGRGRLDVVMIITIGTGLGTAIFTDGHLLPNTELGHIEIQGQDAEWIASDATRKRENLSWKKWAKRLNIYLSRLEALFSPDLMILGGGVSKESDNFIPQLQLNTEVVPAQLRNEAGIIGVAVAASSLAKEGR